MTNTTPEYGSSHVIVYTSTPAQPSLLDESEGYLVLARCEAPGCRFTFPGEGVAPFDSEDQAREAAITKAEKHRAARAKVEKAEARAAAARVDLPGQTVWGFDR